MQQEHHHAAEDDELGVVGVVGLIILVSLVTWPRLVILAFAIIDTDLFSRAYDSWVVPVAGFFLLPWTTLAYAAFWDSGRHVTGIEWFFIVLAFLIDLGSYGSGRRAQMARA